jgi:hypothetical protein
MKRTTNSAKWAAVLNDWTKADADAAAKQGWGIFDVGSPSRKRKPVGPFDFNYPPFELMSIDETRILKDDAAAFDLVRQLVAEGDPLGLKAKAFLQKHSKVAHDTIFPQED